MQVCRCGAKIKPKEGEHAVRREIESFFAGEKIEYFAALDYNDVCEINHGLLERNSLDARSIIVFLLPYYVGGAVNLSEYSASLDYHILIKDVTSRLISLLRELYPENKFVGFGDHSPIDERGAALAAGLGMLGKNGLIINEKYGTYVFVADVISDLLPDELGAMKPEPVLKCEGCGACLKACPTGILRAEGNDCLSAITQRKGELEENEVELMRKYNTVWGCDICQTACPHNRAPIVTPLEFFHKERIDLLTAELLDGMDDSQFEKRAFAWRKRKTIERNLKLLDY